MAMDRAYLQGSNEDANMEKGLLDTERRERI